MIRLPVLSSRAALLSLLATVGLVAAASAQVGYAPGTSPYSDINSSTSLTPSIGYLYGTGGRFGVGPKDGKVYGLSYTLRSNKFIEVGLGFSVIDAQREIVNPYVVLVNRYSGPVSQRVYLPELKFTFNLTGGKTWHHLAPFVGVGLGLGVGPRTAADTSGYDFGKKFVFSPSVGLRVFLTHTVAIKLQATGVTWKLSYPPSYGLEPVQQPGTIASPNAVISDANYKNWTLTPMLSAGLVLPVRLL